MNTKRVFRLWHYTVSHGTLIIRSPKSQDQNNTMDYVFADVQQLNCPDKMTDLQVSEVGAVGENDMSYKVFELSCEEGVFSVIALAVSFRETLLDAMDVAPYLSGDRSISEEVYFYAIKEPVEGKGRFLKQIGGKGNFAELHIRLEPAQDMIGTVRAEPDLNIPREYFPTIYSTLNKCRKNWPDLALDATLIDIAVVGGVHLEVDASQFSYRQAAILAWQDAIARAGRLEKLVVRKLCFDENNQIFYKEVPNEELPNYLKYGNR